MQFFSIDPATHQVLVSYNFWIYFALSLPLTALTIMAWKWITQRALALEQDQGNLEDPSFINAKLSTTTIHEISQSLAEALV